MNKFEPAYVMSYGELLELKDKRIVKKNDQTTIGYLKYFRQEKKKIDAEVKKKPFF